jgi:hypothetical protein
LFVLDEIMIAQVALIVIAVTVSIHIFRMPTLKSQPAS